MHRSDTLLSHDDNYLKVTYNKTPVPGALVRRNSTLKRDVDTKSIWTLRDGDAYQGLRLTATKTDCAILCAAYIVWFFCETKRIHIKQHVRITNRGYVRVRDNFAHDCIWCWVARGSGVFVDIPTNGLFRIYPSSRHTLSLYNSTQTKAEFDLLDLVKLPAYMKNNKITSALFELAHGTIPEFIITEKAYINYQKLQILIQENDEHKPMFVVTTDTSNYNMVGGIAQRYLSTGLYDTVRGGKEFRTCIVLYIIILS